MQRATGSASFPGSGQIPNRARYHTSPYTNRWPDRSATVGIETDRGLFVSALVGAGYQVFAVNPLSTSR